MKTILLSSLNKVFKDKEPNATEFTSFSSLKNENFSFQLAILPEDENQTVLNIKFSSPIAEDITVYEVKNIPGATTKYENLDNFHYSQDIKEFPDLLMPVDGAVSLNNGEWTSLWFEYKPSKAVTGKQKINITLNAGGVAEEKEFELPQGTLAARVWQGEG